MERKWGGGGLSDSRSRKSKELRGCEKLRPYVNKAYATLLLPPAVALAAALATEQGPQSTLPHD